MRRALVAALVGSAFVLSGCQYLLGLAGQPAFGSVGPGVYPTFDPSGSFDPGFGLPDPSDFPFDPDDPSFSLPPPTAIFTKGSATVTIAGVSTKLGALSGPGTSYAEFGTEVGWTDGEGMYVRYFGTTAPGLPTADGFVTIDRIRGGQHWSTVDPEVCTVTVNEDDSKALSGTATCKGLRWADMMGSSLDNEPPFIEGEPAFDAKVTFTASP